MAPKLLKISPNQIKRLLREVPEPDDQETTDVPHGVLEHLPAIETVLSAFGAKNKMWGFLDAPDIQAIVFCPESLDENLYS